MKFATSTSKGTEGFNISYSSEKKCAESLEDILPKGWKVNFEWAQILFSDVQYQIDKKKKELNIQYNQNLMHWWPELKAELIIRLKAL